MWPELELPGSSVFNGKWSLRIARRLARAEQTMRVRIARDWLRELTQAINALEAEIRRARRTGSPRSSSPNLGWGR